MQASLAQKTLEPSPAIRRVLEEVVAAADRAATLTRQLLLVSRKEAPQPRRLDLNEAVSSLAQMLERALGEDVRLELRLDPARLVTLADAGMLDQVLLNLALNARDAMPSGGDLLVETGAARADDEGAGRRCGQYVWLRVTDAGVGIAPEVLPHIFEPFFTTKERGKGSGLGLSTVFGIVEQHRGWIEVRSEAGRGASFQVFLPALEAAP